MSLAEQPRPKVDVIAGWLKGQPMIQRQRRALSGVEVGPDVLVSAVEAGGNPRAPSEAPSLLAFRLSKVGLVCGGIHERVELGRIRHPEHDKPPLTVGGFVHELRPFVQ